MTQVGFALTLLFAGGAAGKLACGFLAEWLGIVPMVWGTEILTCAGMLSLIWSPTLMIWILLPGVGFMLNGTSSVLYATVAEIIYANARSRGYGLYYAITLGSSAIAPLVYGVVTDSLGLNVYHGDGCVVRPSDPSLKSFPRGQVGWMPRLPAAGAGRKADPIIISSFPGSPAL